MADSFCFVRSSRQRIYLQMRKNLIFAFTFLPHLPPFSSFFDDNLYQNRFNDLHEERDLKYFSYIEFCAYYSSFYYSIYGVLETYNYLFRIPQITQFIKYFIYVHYTTYTNRVNVLLKSFLRRSIHPKLENPSYDDTWLPTLRLTSWKSGFDDATTGRPQQNT